MAHFVPIRSWSFIPVFKANWVQGHLASSLLLLLLLLLLETEVCLTTWYTPGGTTTSANKKSVSARLAITWFDKVCKFLWQHTASSTIKLPKKIQKGITDKATSVQRRTKNVYRKLILLCLHVLELYQLLVNELLAALDSWRDIITIIILSLFLYTTEKNHCTWDKWI